MFSISRRSVFLLDLARDALHYSPSFYILVWVLQLWQTSCGKPVWSHKETTEIFRLSWPSWPTCFYIGLGPIPTQRSPDVYNIGPNMWCTAGLMRLISRTGFWPKFGWQFFGCWQQFRMDYIIQPSPSRQTTFIITTLCEGHCARV